MNVLARSWSASTEPWRVVYAALGLFLVSFTLLHFGFYQHRLIRDTIEYHRYGLEMTHGQVPYRDFRIEYPPGALPVFLLPAVDRPGYLRYEREFQILVGLLAAGTLLAMAWTLQSLRASPRRLAAALGFFALAPLVLGSVVIYRYDMWPAALTVTGLAAILAGRNRLGFASLGVGIAAKLFPAVLIPPAVAYVWRTRGRREALVCLGCAVAVVVLFVVPFLAIAPDGVWSSIQRQASRPLQIESLGSAALLAAHQIGGLHLTMVTSHGSQNLTGSLPHGLGVAESGLLIVSLLGIWTAAALGPARPERLVRYCAASVTAFVVFDKVLSPQFMIWLLPLVPLVRGRRGLVASALLALALLLTQLWFPVRYWDLALRFGAFPSWAVVARDVTLLALLTVLLIRAPAREAPRS
ncbi:MAG TPA: glycosyltransferase 87 family protein [Gaiellaceae bacterium]